jgi:hypothetical protein
MLRCDSSGDLYPLRLPQHQALHASLAASLWHQRLGHPGLPVTNQILQSFSFSCNKTDEHSCSSCRLGKHSRLPFHDSASQTFFPFQLIHSDVWSLDVTGVQSFRIQILCGFP